MSQTRRRLLEWYRRSQRTLPWRAQRDPYRVWVSEIMLQQTRVETVLNYYERFLERFPTVHALADADPDDVRAAWSGLGYYRRARFMHEAARVVVREHRGRFPPTLEGLRALPGFGRYTAGAVASIAFDLPAPAVDGNTARVLARWRGIEGDLSRGSAERAVWAEAEALAAGESPGELTQALIELGATVCLPRNPACARCPLRGGCVAKREDRVHEIPAPKRRPERRSVKLTALVVLTGDRALLLAQQPERAWFGGLYTPPLLEGHRSARAAVSAARSQLGLELTQVCIAGRLEHALTHRRLELRLVSARHEGPVPPGLRAVCAGDLQRLGIPTITTKVLEHVLPEDWAQGEVLPSRRAAAIAAGRRRPSPQAAG